MSWLKTLVVEGWPVFGAIGLVSLITWGALRPYLKRDAALRNREAESSED